jgi:hypothetical protein
LKEESRVGNLARMIRKCSPIVDNHKINIFSFEIMQKGNNIKIMPDSRIKHDLENDQIEGLDLDTRFDFEIGLKKYQSNAMNLHKISHPKN